MGFYPRHPRGWRPGVVAGNGKIRDVSIHATLAGGDAVTSGKRVDLLVVSIHATLAGGDARCWGNIDYGIKVSIHATLAGGDLIYRYLASTGTACFYPRHPRGWRRCTVENRCPNSWCFYPRHPRGWRPMYWLTPMPEDGFYPRHPRGWRLAEAARQTGAKQGFYPRHPRGWRLS